jgi:hypothetical protein
MCLGAVAASPRLVESRARTIEQMLVENAVCCSWTLLMLMRKVGERGGKVVS